MSWESVAWSVFRLETSVWIAQVKERVWLQVDSDTRYTIKTRINIVAIRSPDLWISSRRPWVIVSKWKKWLYRAAWSHLAQQLMTDRSVSTDHRLQTYSSTRTKSTSCQLELLPLPPFQLVDHLHKLPIIVRRRFRQRAPGSTNLSKSVWGEIQYLHSFANSAARNPAGERNKRGL